LRRSINPDTSGKDKRKEKYRSNYLKE